MKKILVLLLVLLNFSLLQTNAGELKSAVVETKYDYEKSYEISKKIRDLDKYYYSIVFEKNDEDKIY